MDVLPYNFRACQLCGMWFENRRYFALKTLYKFAVLAIIFNFVSCQIIELFTTRKSVKEFTQVLHVTCSFISTFLKVLNFVLRRREMLELLRYFRLSECQAQSIQEQSIMRSRRRSCALVFLYLMGINIPTSVMFSISALINSDGGEIRFPVESYKYLDVSNKGIFWFWYIQEGIAANYSIVLNVAMDTMAFGFLILTAGQFEINCCRFANSKVFTLQSCIRHYLVARTIALKVQAFFMPVTLPLFCFSLVTLCTSIFEMSQKRLGSFEFWAIFAYLICMFYIVFLYCVFGNNLETQSSAVSAAIYSSPWLECSDKEKRDKWFIMLFAQRAFKVSFHGQCTLSLKTFLWIVKTSYAALNLLKQMSKSD